MNNRTMLLAAVFVAVLAACNQESPTEPPALVPLTSARLDFSMATTSSHTIRIARMTLDGREVAKAEVPGGGGQVRLQATVETRRDHTSSDW